MQFDVTMPLAASAPSGATAARCPFGAAAFDVGRSDCLVLVPPARRN
jgi:hypothetical protein